MVDYTLITASGKEYFTKTLAEAKRIAQEYDLLDDDPYIDKNVDEELTDTHYRYLNGKWVKFS